MRRLKHITPQMVNKNIYKKSFLFVLISNLTKKYSVSRCEASSNPSRWSDVARVPWLWLGLFQHVPTVGVPLPQVLGFLPASHTQLDTGSHPRQSRNDWNSWINFSDINQTIKIYQARLGLWASWESSFWNRETVFTSVVLTCPHLFSIQSPTKDASTCHQTG